jgi:ribosomal protein L12E/L44/L45/RPP1/RPP2
MTIAAALLARMAASIAPTDFDTVLAKIAQDADESRAKFAAGLLEGRPIHQIAVVHRHRQLLAPDRS